MTLHTIIQQAITYMGLRQKLMDEFLAAGYHPTITQRMAELKIAQQGGMK